MDGFHRESLSQDVKLLLDVCQDLQRSRSQKACITELEDHTIGLSNELLNTCVREVVPYLSYATLLRLSLATSHFDASSLEPSPGLIAFLRMPHDNAVWEILHLRYESLMHQSVPFDDFKRSFDFLLIPDLI